MGDRAQIIVEYEGGARIHLYTHWEGYRLPAILTEGLKAGRPRWNDDSYLTRIIFCRMVTKDGLHDETGFGISPHYQDSCEKTDLIVDTVNQRVRYMTLEWSFDEWVKFGPASWEALT